MKFLWRLISIQIPILFVCLGSFCGSLLFSYHLKKIADKYPKIVNKNGRLRMLSQRLIALRCLNSSCFIDNSKVEQSAVRIMIQNSSNNPELVVDTKMFLNNYFESSVSTCDLFAQSLQYVDNVDRFINNDLIFFVNEYQRNFYSILVFFIVMTLLIIASVAVSIKLMIVKTQQSIQQEKEIMQYLFHEIRNPLNQILYSINTLSHENLRITKKSCEAAGSFILEVLNNVLLMASLENRKDKIHTDVFSLFEICKECCEMFSSRIQIDLIAKQDHVKPSDLWYRGHFKALKQVIVNLISNSIAHCAEDVRITIEFEILSKEGEFHSIKISIIDDGPGLSDYMKSFTFNKFSAINRRSGTGLGLYLCQQLTIRLGGDISVESPFRFANKGTCFSINVRLENVLEPPQRVLVTESDILNLKPLTILICDDESFNLKILNHMLLRTDLQIDKIHQCDSLQECLQLCLDVNFDLIFLDEFFKTEYPLTGSQFICKLRESSIQSPIVIASANCSDEDAVLFKKRGALTNISKPYPLPKELRKLINEILSDSFKSD